MGAGTETNKSKRDKVEGGGPGSSQVYARQAGALLGPVTGTRGGSGNSCSGGGRSYHSEKIQVGLGLARGNPNYRGLLLFLE